MGLNWLGYDIEYAFDLSKRKTNFSVGNFLFFLSFFVIPFYLQSVVLHSANYEKNIYSGM
jgi:hypothetical protein